MTAWPWICGRYSVTKHHDYKRLKVCKLTLYNEPQSSIETEYWERKKSRCFPFSEKKNDTTGT